MTLRMLSITAGIFALIVLASAAPDLKRYMRIHMM